MSLSFSTPRGEVEQRWIIYALLRDNVQHHIENGAPSGEFTELHACASALTSTSIRVSAARLHAELERAWKVLNGRPISDLAISLRTRAALSFAWPPPEQRETILVREWGGTIPLLGGSPQTLDDVFGHLLTRLLQITDGVSEDTQLEVRDL